ncbi:MAG: NAD(P)H-hydrate dehydratase [Methanobacteriota archaeon]|nr:MAG: NAD(P)H-hydrate dehydratase [Euryarchaeota archaeon]
MLAYEEVKVLDINSEYHGVPTIRLMENAGQAVADVVRKKFDVVGKSVLVVCGTGNNGGDGFVAARYLNEHCTVRVVLAKRTEDIQTAIATKNFARIEDEMEIVESASNLGNMIRSADVIVDALLGIGISGKLREPHRSIVKRINKSKKPVVSIDVPSGLGTDLAIRPGITVALHDRKEGQTKENSGQILVRGIGIPEEAELYAGPGSFVYYPIPAEDSHKGDNGRILVVSGGPYTGAAALTGIAAYRMGADLVQIATPKKSYGVIASFSPSLIVHPLSSDILVPEDIPQIAEIAKRAEAIVVGPGLGAEKETLTAIGDLIKSVDKPYVIDADGITAVAKDMSCLKKRKGIMTPHNTEFKRLAKKKVGKTLESQIKQVSALASSTKFTILRKGRVDIISDGKKVRLNETGNQAMTVGGTGDILAGLCGALLSKDVEPFNAARMAAFTSGYAGQLAFIKKSFGMMPMDVVEEIPNVLKEYL